MKRFIITLVILMLIAYVVTSFAQETQKSIEAQEKFNQMFPNFQFESFRESPIPGLYEIVGGTEVLYFSPEGYLIFGEMFSKDGRNITAERRTELISKKVESIPEEKAIVVGNGSKKVIEFSDPDCPFCRRAHKYFESRTDVKRYVYLYPLKQLHPNAEKKAKYILCSSKPAEAYKDVYSGKMDDKELNIPKECEESAQKRLEEVQIMALSLGITGTPTFYVNGKLIRGADISQLEKVLKDMER